MSAHAPGSCADPLCVPCAIAGEPRHFRLGRLMAQKLRDTFGDAAESKIPECYSRANASGDWLQRETVRMAEKFLIGRQASSQKEPQ